MEIRTKSLACRKFACSYTYDEKAPPLPLPLFWKGSLGNALAMPPFSGIPVHIILLPLFTRCCRLQCVTAMNLNYQRSPETEQFITATISGNVLKHGRTTRSVLRQDSLQLQKYKAARMSRRMAIDLKLLQRGWRTPRFDSLKLAKLHKNWECAWSSQEKFRFLLCGCFMYNH